MSRLTRILSKTFVSTMMLLLFFGIGLFILAQIISLAGRSTVTAPVGGVASRFRTFATTGT